MSVLAREDIALRVSAALEAAFAADAEAPKAKIWLASSGAARPAVTEPEVMARVGIEADGAPASDDDDWVVAPVEVIAVIAEPARPIPSPPLTLHPATGTRARRSNVRGALAAVLFLLAGLGVVAAIASRSSGSGALGANASLDRPPRPESATSNLRTLRGTFTVWNGGTAADPCAPIRSGAEPIEGDAVRLRGAQGGRLIMGALGSGSPTAARTGCSFPFVLPNVPPADNYVIAVSREGSMTFSSEQLEAVHWQVSMSFGSPSAG